MTASPVMGYTCKWSKYDFDSLDSDYMYSRILFA